MNKTELVEVVSSKAEITKVEAGKVVGAALDSIIEGLEADGKVVLVGFGTFEVRTRKGKEKARNPKTGETVSTDDHKVAYFRPGQELKKMLWDLKD